MVPTVFFLPYPCALQKYQLSTVTRYGSTRAQESLQSKIRLLCHGAGVIFAQVSTVEALKRITDKDVSLKVGVVRERLRGLYCRCSKLSGDGAS